MKQEWVSGWRSTLIEAKVRGQGIGIGELWRGNWEGGYHLKCKQIRPVHLSGAEYPAFSTDHFHRLSHPEAYLPQPVHVHTPARKAWPKFSRQYVFDLRPFHPSSLLVCVYLNICSEEWNHAKKK